MGSLTTANTLKEQRESLCLQLQQNRQIVARMLVESSQDFPRSFAMRLLTKNKTAVGLRLFRLIAYGFSFLTFIKRRSAHPHHVERSKPS